MWVLQFYSKPMYTYQCWLFNITSDENKLSTLFVLQHSKTELIFIKSNVALTKPYQIVSI